MKNFILFFLTNLFLLPVFTQDLELYFEDELLAPEETLFLQAHADSGMMAVDGIDVRNNSIQPLNVVCVREVMQAVENSENYFCWGLCYSPVTDTSVVSIKLENGERSSLFSGHYDPKGVSGSSLIRYIFYDQANPGFRTSFYVEYKASGTPGINPAAAVEYSPAYPNPANGITKIDYSLKGAPKEARLVIYNLLGRVEQEITVTETSGSLTVNTSGLTEGIYFYSFLINRESTSTHKLVIKH